jgi:hypothetical protein
MSPRRAGRPTKSPIPGRLAPLSVRITATLKAELQKAADQNGRSISAEVESRLERSMTDWRIEEALADALKQMRADMAKRRK